MEGKKIKFTNYNKIKFQPYYCVSMTIREGPFILKLLMVYFDNIEFVEKFIIMY